MTVSQQMLYLELWSCTHLSVLALAKSLFAYNLDNPNSEIKQHINYQKSTVQFMEVFKGFLLISIDVLTHGSKLTQLNQSCPFADIIPKLRIHCSIFFHKLLNFYGAPPTSHHVWDIMKLCLTYKRETD